MLTDINITQVGHLPRQMIIDLYQLYIFFFRAHTFNTNNWKSLKWQRVYLLLT